MNTITFRAALLIAAMALALTSCNSEPSLQQYYVDSQEKDNFVTTTIPKSILGLDVSNMSASSQEAYNSINKVNVLYYPVNDSDMVTFEKENAMLQKIISSDDYKTLMKHKQDGMNMQVVYEGDPKDIDEIIVYGMANEMGLGVARILGDDMNLGGIMKMMEEMKDVNVDSSGMMEVLKDLGMNPDANEEEMKKIIEEQVEKATETI